MMTRKEALKYLMEIKYIQFPQGDDIYLLDEKERGRIEGYNEAVSLVKEIIIREVGNNL